VTTLAPSTVWATAAAAACASIFFGASVTATRYVVAEVDPLLLAFLRYVIAAVCLIPFVLLRQRARVSAPDLLRIAMLGIVFFGLFPWFFSAGLQYIPASRGAVWLATMPFLTFALALALRYETFTSMKAWGIALATLGVILALSPRGERGSSGEQTWLGDLLLFATACCGAVYFVLSRGVLTRQPALLVTCLSMISGATFLALFTLASGEAQLPRLGAAGWAAVLFLGTFGAAVGFYLWVWALQRMTPSRDSRLPDTQPNCCDLVSRAAAWRGDHRCIPLRLALGAGGHRHGQPPTASPRADACVCHPRSAQLNNS
jgi:drug/metabolite transporter (DMT)-like permease